MTPYYPRRPWSFAPRPSRTCRLSMRLRRGDRPVYDSHGFEPRAALEIFASQQRHILETGGIAVVAGTVRDHRLRLVVVSAETTGSSPRCSSCPGASRPVSDGDYSTWSGRRPRQAANDHGRDPARLERPLRRSRPESRHAGARRSRVTAAGKPMSCGRRSSGEVAGRPDRAAAYGFDRAEDHAYWAAARAPTTGPGRRDRRVLVRVPGGAIGPVAGSTRRRGGGARRRARARADRHGHGAHSRVVAPARRSRAAGVGSGFRRRPGFCCSRTASSRPTRSRSRATRCIRT